MCLGIQGKKKNYSTGCLLKHLRRHMFMFSWRAPSCGSANNISSEEITLSSCVSVAKSHLSNGQQGATPLVSKEVQLYVNLWENYPIFLWIVLLSNSFPKNLMVSVSSFQFSSSFWVMVWFWVVSKYTTNSSQSDRIRISSPAQLFCQNMVTSGSRKPRWWRLLCQSWGLKTGVKLATSWWLYTWRQWILMQLLLFLCVGGVF